MKLIFKLLLFLLVVGGIALVGYAYLGDLTPEQQDVNQPVILDGS